MNILQSIVLGVVEGLTEFLPISSTFHLIFAGNLLGLSASPFVKLFEVFIQAGAISALLFIYLRTLLQNLRLTSFVLLSFLPTAVFGALLYGVIKLYFFDSQTLMLAAFVFMGIIFLLIENLVARGRLTLHKTLSDLTTRDSLLIGLAQVFAVVPGVSRAGSVMVGMMGLGYTREIAAQYTFLLSLPTILAASAYDLFKSRSLLAGATQYTLLAVGFLTAFIVAYLTVNWFLGYIKSHTLTLFAWYRFALGLVLLLYLYA